MPLTGPNDGAGYTAADVPGYSAADAQRGNDMDPPVDRIAGGEENGYRYTWQIPNAIDNSKVGPIPNTAAMRSNIPEGMNISTNSTHPNMLSGWHDQGSMPL